MILSGYINREIIRPLALISLVLVLLMISYSAVSYFSDASVSIISPKTAALVILAKTVVAFELFLPLALFLTILLGLGKLHAGHEIAALNAAGVGNRGIIRMLLPLIFVITLLSAVTTILVRPWAYSVRYESLNLAEQTLDFERIEAGHFYTGEEDGTTYFAADVDEDGRTKHRVFINEADGADKRVIYAETAYHVGSKPPVMVFLNGSAHRLDATGNVDWIIVFKRMTVLPKQDEVMPLEFKRKAASTAYLSRSAVANEVAEYQWRITNPIKVLLLALIAVFLAKTAPRQGRYGKLALGIVVFFGVHALNVLSRTWLEQTVLPFWPGLWWPVIVLSVVVIYLVKKEA